MAHTTTEIMMQFIGTDGIAIKAECETVINENDLLAINPTAGYANGFMRGRYFLVDSFRMGMTLSDSETANKEPPPQPVEPKPQLRTPPTMKRVEDVPYTQRGGKAGPVPPTTNSEGSFMRWRTAKLWNKKTDGEQPYNARMDDFSFTRRMDIASTKLFYHWHRQLTFPFASIVKRKSAPVGYAETPQNVSYVRIDFKDLQISGLQWSDDDVVEESCTFRAKKLRVQYWSMDDWIDADADSFMNAYDYAEWVNKAAESTGDTDDG